MSIYRVEDKYGNVVEFCEANSDQEALIIAQELVAPGKWFYLTDENGNEVTQ